jgi:hypothetical protein
MRIGPLMAVPHFPLPPNDPLHLTVISYNTIPFSQSFCTSSGVYPSHCSRMNLLCSPRTGAGMGILPEVSENMKGNPGISMSPYFPMKWVSFLSLKLFSDYYDTFFSMLFSVFMIS